MSQVQTSSLPTARSQALAAERERLSNHKPCFTEQELVARIDASDWPEYVKGYLRAKAVGSEMAADLFKRTYPMVFHSFGDEVFREEGLMHQIH